MSFANFQVVEFVFIVKENDTCLKIVLIVRCHRLQCTTLYRKDVLLQRLTISFFSIVIRIICANVTSITTKNCVDFW